MVVEVTEGDEGDRFLRADAVEVLEASADRVEPPCPFAGPGRCGGCDFQHVDLPAQRALKAAVVAEQLRRLAGLDAGGGRRGGARRRRRAGLAHPRAVGGRPGRDGRPAPAPLPRRRAGRRLRDRAPGLPDVTGQEWPDASAVEAIVSATGERLRLVSTRDGSRFADGPLLLHERAAGRDWQVTGSGFWQVHPGAADALVGAVLEGLAPEPGERALDLYAGVGLFSAALAARVGPAGHVLAVEGDETAVEDAAVNLADLPQVSVLVGRVDRVLADRSRRPTWWCWTRRGPVRSAEVVAAIAATSPRAVAYVACDPAALARDVAFFAEHGYELASLRAFDLFPMTHHVECVAVLSRRRVS